MTRFFVCLWVLALLPTACGRSKSTADAAREPGDTGADAEPSFEGGAPDANADGANADGVDAGGVDARPDGGVGVDAPDLPDANTDTDATPASGSPWRVLALATGVVDSCVLLDNHRVKCWGNNAYGSLGTGDMRARGAAADMGDALPFVDLGTGRTAKAISSGRYHSCAILDDGSVKCWGYRPMTGQPQIDGQVGIGDEPGEMGDALPPLDLGGHEATHVACGYFVSCAALDDGSARCWSSEGPTRTPTVVSLGSTSKVRQLAQAKGSVVALFEDGTISHTLSNGALWGLDGFAAKSTYVAGSPDAACAVGEGGVRCVATGATTPSPDVSDLAAVGVGWGTFRCGLSKLGDVRCWAGGSCDRPLPGTVYWCPGARLADGSAAVPLGQKAVALGSGGQNHECALLADGGVKCWTTHDWCVNASGASVLCAVPEKPDLLLGGSIDVVGTGTARAWGAWRSVDLGKHP